MERDGDAVIVRFPMPMRREVTLSLETLGARRVEVEASLDVEARPFDDDAMHFHAAFLGRLRNDAALRPTDLRLLAVRGAGRYVGVVLDVANGDPQWWGEGDHRFTVDGDDGRAHRGTGTEDYFHLAWCSTERFTAAFNGQLRANGPAPTGFATLYRFHVLDAVPFERAFTFDLEAVLWGTTVRVAPLALTGATFFYASPGAVIERAALDAASAAPLPLPPDVARDRPGTYVCR
jgi:hypothetical protein